MDDNPLLTMVTMTLAVVMMVMPLLPPLPRLIITTYIPLFLSICVPLRGPIRQWNV